MKTSTFVVALACSVALVTGCKTSPERFTKFPGGQSLADSQKMQNLNADPLHGGPGALGQPAVGTDVQGADIRDFDDINGRDQDRSVFKDQTVYFEYDQSNVKSAEAAKLDQVIAALKSRGTGYDLLIEGHCDERGTEEYNRSLGERRALALRELLMKSGLEGQRVYTLTLGKDRPAAIGHDEESMSKNRRGEFVLVLPKKIITTQNTQ
jgi:outer membrane protein OmpA-like peptidoglycan-associated protein